MYTDKKSILQLASLLRSFGIKRIVLCPGSRNIPIVQTFANIPDFTCYPMTDERSAGFFALGLALHGGNSCCCVLYIRYSIIKFTPSCSRSLLPASSISNSFSRSPSSLDWTNGWDRHYHNREYSVH